ncbi:acyl-CoA dehydrogenase [Streptomyces sp. NPDC000594]|uniref:acyl-CoA dehydrogenase family protein n=1 Tax=Streptomyces sp. NPDC000594 TaxID=3154261 RepID=UPI00332B370E
MTLLTLQMTRTDARQDEIGGSFHTTHHRGTTQSAAVGELSHLLFEQHDRERVHGTWRELIAGEEFAYRPHLSPTERTALTYDRLRLLNEVVPSATDLANDARRLAALHEWAGVVDGGLGTLASIHYNLFLGSLLDHDHEDRDLSRFTSLEQTGTFLCTELEHGNDVAALQTLAVHDRATGGFVLHTPTPGAQKFMPNTSLTGGPKSAVVAARLLIDGQDQGIYLFLTPLSDHDGHLPGVQVRKLPERTGTPMDHCLTSFDRVWLPREALLEADHGRLDDEGRLNSTVGNRRKRLLSSISRVTSGKLCMSAGALGVSRAALAIAVRYGHDRHISAPRAGERIPVVAHRSHHAPLLHSLATAYAMTFLHRTVVDRWVGHTAENQAEAERLVAITKGWVTWQSRAITTECRERCGAQGLFPANGISELTMATEGTITAEGDNLVIWVKAASEMIFGQETVERGHLGPLSPDQDLTDLRFLRGLLAEVESIWQERARRSLREGPSGDPMARWNGTSSAALEMVGAHARLQAADALLAAAAQAVEPDARYLLHGLCLLFLLKQVSAHTGDLLAEGLMSADHVRQLPAAIDAAVAHLAPHMLTLVDAFDLPEELLSRVPIASGGQIDRYASEPEGTRSASVLRLPLAC